MTLIRAAIFNEAGATALEAEAVYERMKALDTDTPEWEALRERHRALAQKYHSLLKRWESLQEQRA